MRKNLGDLLENLSMKISHLHFIIFLLSMDRRDNPWPTVAQLRGDERSDYVIFTLLQKFSNFCNTFDLFEVAHTFDYLLKLAVREYKLILNNEELVNFVIEDPTRHSTLCRVLITCRNMNKCVGLLPTTERF